MGNLVSDEQFLFSTVVIATSADAILSCATAQGLERLESNRISIQPWQLLRRRKPHDRYLGHTIGISVTW